MSYDILYNRCFIKAEKDNETVFFPMVYCGSSNCTESYQTRRGWRERRERSWFLLTYPLYGKRFATLEEFSQSLEKRREELIQSNKESNERYKSEGKESWCNEYSDERWGYFTAIAINGTTHSLTYQRYKGFFINGCKNAMTVEELRKYSVSVDIHSAIWTDENKKKFDEAGKTHIHFTPKTSQELMEKLEEFDEYLKDFPFVSLYVSIDASEYIMERIRKEKFARVNRPKKIVEVDKYFVLYVINYGYFYKATRNGFRYTPYQNSGKRFISEKATISYQKKFAQRHGSYPTAIETVNEKTTVRV